MGEPGRRSAARRGRRGDRRLRHVRRHRRALPRPADMESEVRDAAGLARGGRAGRRGPGHRGVAGGHGRRGGGRRPAGHRRAGPARRRRRGGAAPRGAGRTAPGCRAGGGDGGGRARATRWCRASPSGASTTWRQGGWLPVARVRGGRRVGSAGPVRRAPADGCPGGGQTAPSTTPVEDHFARRGPVRHGRTRTSSTPSATRPTSCSPRRTWAPRASSTRSSPGATAPSPTRWSTRGSSATSRRGASWWSPRRATRPAPARRSSPSIHGVTGWATEPGDRLFGHVDLGSHRRGRPLAGRRRLGAGGHRARQPDRHRDHVRRSPNQVFAFPPDTKVFDDERRLRVPALFFGGSEDDAHLRPRDQPRLLRRGARRGGDGRPHRRRPQHDPAQRRPVPRLRHGLDALPAGRRRARRRRLHRPAPRAAHRARLDQPGRQGPAGPPAPAPVAVPLQPALPITGDLRRSCGRSPWSGSRSAPTAHTPQRSGGGVAGSRRP